MLSYEETLGLEVAMPLRGVQESEGFAEQLHREDGLQGFLEPRELMLTFRGPALLRQLHARGTFQAVSHVAEARGPPEALGRLPGEAGARGAGDGRVPPGQERGGALRGPLEPGLLPKGPRPCEGYDGPTGAA